MERKKKKTSAEGFLSFTGQQTETEKARRSDFCSDILGSCGVMRSDGLTSADGNTLPSAEEPGVQLFSEADVRCCRCPVQSQVSENYTSLLLKH